MNDDEEMKSFVRLLATACAQPTRWNRFRFWVHRKWWLLRALMGLFVLGCSSTPPEPLHDYTATPHGPEDTDPRRGQVVVETPELEHSTLRAAQYWSDATFGDAALQVVTECTRWPCIRVRWSDEQLSDDADGHWWADEQGREQSISIRPGLTNAPLLAHELGHALRLPHVEGEIVEVMTATVGEVTGPETRGAWRDVWGTEIREWWIE